MLRIAEQVGLGVRRVGDRVVKPERISLLMGGKKSSQVMSGMTKVRPSEF